MQKIKKYLNKKRALLLWVFAISMCHLNLNAQSIQINAGSVISNYQFVSDDGVKADYLKAGAGNYYAISSDFQLLDTTKFLSSTSQKSFYYSKHRSLATFLSRTDWSLGIESLQLNAVGDVYNQAFNYQTSYLGLNTGLKYQQPLGGGWYFGIGGKFSGLKILQGNQELLGTYRDLTKDENFNSIKLGLGWEISFGKKVSPSLNSFISFSKINTIAPVKSGVSTLNFNNSMFSIGLKFNVTKSQTF